VIPSSTCMVYGASFSTSLHFADFVTGVGQSSLCGACCISALTHALLQLHVHVHVSVVKQAGLRPSAAIRNSMWNRCACRTLLNQASWPAHQQGCTGRVAYGANRPAKPSSQVRRRASSQQTAASARSEAEHASRWCVCSIALHHIGATADQCWSTCCTVVTMFGYSAGASYQHLQR
jgi:hypothetical protein